MIDLSSLGRSAMLQGLGESDLRSLAGIATERQARAGERIIRRGAEAEALYLVKAGQFDLSVRLRALGDQAGCVIESQARGDSFGWSALVEPHRSIYFVDCAIAGELVVLPRMPLEALMQGDPALGLRLMRNVCQLVGSRARVLQQYWIEEVQNSIARVEYWTHRPIFGPQGEEKRRAGMAKEGVGAREQTPPGRGLWQRITSSHS